jgi:hypothetical protein
VALAPCLPRPYLSTLLPATERRGGIPEAAVHRAAIVALTLALASAPSEARKLPRNYLAFAGGGKVLTADVSGDVIDTRATGHVEIGVGMQISKPLLVEFTYGWEGTFRQDPPILALSPVELPPSDAERAFQVGLNPILFRLRYAPGGMRTGYLKPEWSLAAGWVQVTRLLRNYPGFDFEQTSQMLAAAELGGSALVVFSKNFMGTVGARYTITERRGVVDATHNLDGLTLLIGFRTFLLSPRDANEP